MLIILNEDVFSRVIDNIHTVDLYRLHKTCKKFYNMFNMVLKYRLNALLNDRIINTRCNVISKGEFTGETIESTRTGTLQCRDLENILIWEIQDSSDY